MSSIGVKIPLTSDDFDGFTMIKSIQGMVRQNFKMLILTMPGERVMHPEFGVGLHQYMFQNASATLVQTIKDRILDKTKKFLPVIVINNIDVRLNPDQNSLQLRINYTIPNIAANDLMEITI